MTKQDLAKVMEELEKRGVFIHLTDDQWSLIIEITRHLNVNPDLIQWEGLV